MSQNIQDRIREEAYYMWQSNGCPDGMDMEYWLCAEQNILNGTKKKTATKKSAAKKSAVAVVSDKPKKKKTATRKKAAQ